MMFQFLDLQSVQIFSGFVIIFLVNYLYVELSAWSSLVGVFLFLHLYMHAPSSFVGIYDVSHFIKTLKYDVRLVMSIPEITPNGKTKKLKAHLVNRFEGH